MSDSILFLDTTLRDGEQTPGVNLNLSEKLELAMQLEKLGVDVIEAGFPAASPGDLEAVQAVARSVRCGVAALCRAREDDIRKAAEALKGASAPRIHIFIATSPVHMAYKLRMTEQQVLQATIQSITLARSLCADVEFSAEDATRTALPFLFQVLEAAIDAGATTVNIPDTVGYTTPSEYRALIENVFLHVPNIAKAVVSVHCHNDLGLAAANSLSGLLGGARQVECTVNGLGERAGNAALEEIAMALATRSDFYDFSHNIRSYRIHRISQLVSGLTGVEIPACKAIVGANAFRHESGIHQHGVLANPATYEIMTPASIGMTHSDMVLGKLSGRHAFVERILALGYTLEENELNEAFERFKVLADRKKDITDRDLDALVSGTMGEIAQIYELDTFQIQSSNKMAATASIVLIYEGQNIAEASVGDGPVDAAFRAIDKLVTLDCKLDSYGIRAVTGGQDALGEVTVRIAAHGQVYMGKGLSTDIIEASIKAYLNAINRAVLE